MSNETPAENAPWALYADLLRALGNAATSAALVGGGVSLLVIAGFFLSTDPDFPGPLVLLAPAAAALAFGASLRARGLEIVERLRRGQALP